jgi:nucleotide-binding universal stress UspA family protein
VQEVAMQTIEKVIVPVDFHQHTNDLADFATNIATKLEASLFFVHVSSVAEQALSLPDYSPEGFKLLNGIINAHAEKRMADLIDKSKNSFPGCKGVVLDGEVVDVLIDYTIKNNIDLIIMGTHGAQGIKKILLGSVTERMLKRSSCPILVFNPYKGERGYKISSSIIPI